MSFSHDVVDEASRRCSKPAAVNETRQICASGEECVSVVGSLKLFFFFFFVKNHFQVGPRKVLSGVSSECGVAYFARVGENPKLRQLGENLTPVLIVGFVRSLEISHFWRSSLLGNARVFILNATCGTDWCADYVTTA